MKLKSLLTIGIISLSQSYFSCVYGNGLGCRRWETSSCYRWRNFGGQRDGYAFCIRCLSESTLPSDRRVTFSVVPTRRNFWRFGSYHSLHVEPLLTKKAYASLLLLLLLTWVTFCFFGRECIIYLNMLKYLWLFRLDQVIVYLHLVDNFFYLTQLSI